MLEQTLFGNIETPYSYICVYVEVTDLFLLRSFFAFRNIEQIDD